MANVLLLEPDKVLSRTYAQALEHIGYRAYSVQDGQDAIEALETFPADLIVLELQLAGHGGIEFLHELRSYPEWQDLPVIVNTNVAPAVLGPLLLALQRDVGVTVCLYKPHTSLRRLLQAIKHQLVVGDPS